MRGKGGGEISKKQFTSKFKIWHSVVMRMAVEAKWSGRRGGAFSTQCRALKRAKFNAKAQRRRDAKKKQIRILEPIDVQWFAIRVKVGQGDGALTINDLGLMIWECGERGVKNRRFPKESNRIKPDQTISSKWGMGFD